MTARVFMVDDPSEGKGGGRNDPPLYDLFMKGGREMRLPSGKYPTRSGVNYTLFMKGKYMYGTSDLQE